MKLPIFVVRQWIRHRTANVNEYSARYSVLDREFYIPGPEHLAAQSASNRQGRGDILQGIEATEVLVILRRDAEQAYDDYALMPNDGPEGNQCAGAGVPVGFAGADGAAAGIARQWREDTSTALSVIACDMLLAIGTVAARA